MFVMKCAKGEREQTVVIGLVMFVAYTKVDVSHNYL